MADCLAAFRAVGEHTLVRIGMPHDHGHTADGRIVLGALGDADNHFPPWIITL
jgi:hypothetical protein